MTCEDCVLSGPHCAWCFQEVDDTKNFKVKLEMFVVALSDEVLT